MLAEVWDRATSTQPVPDVGFVVATGVLALVLVLAPATWPRVRLGITVVHEAGHALVGVLVGRRLKSIHLHSDTSGLTVTRGRGARSRGRRGTTPHSLGRFRGWNPGIA